MLHEDLVVKGQPAKCIIPEDVSVGEYYLECLRKRDPDDIFCIDGVTGVTLTCAELLDRTLKTVAVLRKQGINPGDVVAIIAENCMEYCIAYFAIYYSGAVAHLLNPAYTTGELQRIFLITKPKLIFCTKSVLKNLYSINNENKLEYQIILLKKDDSVQDELVLEKCLESTVLNDEDIQPPQVYSNSQTLAILLSSGTTGLPKCLMISEANVKYSVAIFGNPDFMKSNPGEIALAVLPFFHVFGSAIMATAVMYSAKFVILPSFQPFAYLDSIQKYKITTLYVVPPIVSFIAQHPMVKKFDVSSVKTVLCGGNTLEVAIIKECYKALPNADISVLYGLTEYSGVAVMRPRNNKSGSKLASVGILVPNAQAIIWNSDLKCNVGPLETGEICLRGPLIMKGYMEETCKDIDDNGFLHTGDVGYYDEDGYFYIVGRIKELIKYKGFQVAPAEIENLLLEHEAIEECAVVGTPNERAGQLPTAFVVKKPNMDVTEKEIIEYVAERISIHKQLHGGVKFITSLPKNTIGKVLRTRLLEIYETM